MLELFVFLDDEPNCIIAAVCTTFSHFGFDRVYDLCRNKKRSKIFAFANGLLNYKYSISIPSYCFVLVIFKFPVSSRYTSNIITY